MHTHIETVAAIVLLIAGVACASPVSDDALDLTPGPGKADGAVSVGFELEPEWDEAHFTVQCDETFDFECDLSLGVEAASPNGWAELAGAGHGQGEIVSLRVAQLLVDPDDAPTGVFDVVYTFYVGDPSRGEATRWNSAHPERFVVDGVALSPDTAYRITLRSPDTMPAGAPAWNGTIDAQWD